jgi:hypothetical protein
MDYIIEVEKHLEKTKMLIENMKLHIEDMQEWMIFLSGAYTKLLLHSVTVVNDLHKIESENQDK